MDEVNNQLIDLLNKYRQGITIALSISLYNINSLGEIKIYYPYGIPISEKLICLPIYRPSGT